MVFNCEAVPWGLYVGREISVSQSLQIDLDAITKKKFDFIVTPLFHPSLRRDKNSQNLREDPLAKADSLLKSQGAWKNVVVRFSQVVDTESKIESIRRRAEFLLKQEVNYAAHLGVFAIILPGPEKEHSNYSAIINELLKSNLGGLHIWFNIPLQAEENFDSWDIYNEFRLSLPSRNDYGVNLELKADFPDENILNRWLAENIRGVVLSTGLYVMNQKGFPILIKKHETFIKQLMRHKVNFIIKGRRPSEELAEYRNFLLFLFKKQPKMNDYERMEYDWYDKLQIPLQPTKDNLDSNTYAIFEKALVKYQIYQKGLVEILKKKFSDKDRVVIFLVGAGRGPIMREAFRAAEEAKRNIKVYAIEKNVNAVIGLKQIQKQYETDLKGRLTVVGVDIREWNCPEKADILLSELLGSFGDNELSPEILSYAEKLLKPTGFSLPCQYNSYVSPVSCPTIFNKVSRVLTAESPLEEGHLVYFHRHYLPSKIEKCFTFEHPFKEKEDFKRYTSIDFHFQENNLIHGMAGYFDAYLFEKVYYSICPLNKTENLFSWFPIFFPFKTPVNVSKHKFMRFHMWRKTNPAQTWYEWQYEIISEESKEKLSESIIFNLDGKHYHIDL